MVRLSFSVAVRAVGLPESLTIKVRLEVPAQEAVGVPDMTPAEVIARHDGSVPLERVHE
jgi:hypothetical protein